jgi:hypothetical protein
MQHLCAILLCPYHSPGCAAKSCQTTSREQVLNGMARGGICQLGAVENRASAFSGLDLPLWSTHVGSVSQNGESELPGK